MVFAHFQIAVVRFKVYVQKRKFEYLSKSIVEGSEKNRVGVCSVYRMKHCLQGPYQGPLYIPPKGNVILYDQKAKKIKIMMILLVGVHSIVCWDDGHITNY